MTRATGTRRQRRVMRVRRFRSQLRFDVHVAFRVVHEFPLRRNTLCLLQDTDLQWIVGGQTSYVAFQVPRIGIPRMLADMRPSISVFALIRCCFCVSGFSASWSVARRCSYLQHVPPYEHTRSGNVGSIGAASSLVRVCCVHQPIQATPFWCLI